MKPFFLLGEGGVEPPTKFSKRGVAWQGLDFQRVCGKEGVTFFKGEERGCNFYIKDKLTFEIFNDKKSL